MDTIAQIDAFFAGKGEQWALFDALQTALNSRYPDMQIRVMKTCIAFDDPRPFLYVSFPKKKAMSGLILSVSLTEMMRHPRFFMVVSISKSRFTVHIHLKNTREIDGELLELIDASRR